MSYRLPNAGTEARELMSDVATIAEILHPDNVMKLMTVWQARKAAEAAFAANTTGSMKRICFVIIRADSDERWLISFGKRGGWRKEWNFGTGKD